MSTDEVQKLLLSSGNNFIKLVESRYQEPIKQIAALEKRIATLRNPRNLSRASKGVGAWTQYHQNLIKAEGKAKEARAKVEGKVADKLDKYNEVYTEHEQKARNAEAISRRNSLRDALLKTGRKAPLDLKLAEVVGEGEDEASKAQLFVLADLLKDIQNKDPKDQQGQKNKALAIKHIKEKTVEILRTPGVDMRFSVQGAAFFDDIKKAKSADPISYLANSYKDYRNPNYRSTILANPRKFQFIQDSEYGANFDIPSSYVSYQDDIDWVRTVLRGERDASSFPGSNSSVQEQKKYIESAKPSGLTVDEGSGRVIVDPEASEAQKQTAEAFLKEHTGKKNPTYAQFVTSKPMREMATGTATGQMAKERMLALADELEDRKETLVKVAVDAGRLTPAQQSVLNNVLFPRAGYRRTPRYGLLKRRAEARETLAEIEEAEADEAATEEDDSPVNTASPGVPVLVAIHSTIDSAIEELSEAMKSGDGARIELAKDAVRDVLGDVAALPEDLRRRLGRFGSLVSFEALDEASKGLSPVELDLLRENSSLDFAQAQAVGNVADYVASRETGEQGMNESALVTRFLDKHADRFPDLYAGIEGQSLANRNSYLVVGDAGASIVDVGDELSVDQFGMVQALANKATGQGFGDLAGEVADEPSPGPEEEPSPEESPSEEPPDKVDPLDAMTPRQRRIAQRRSREIEKRRERLAAARLSDQQDREMLAQIDEEEDDDTVDPVEMQAVSDILLQIPLADATKKARDQQRIGRFSDDFIPYQRAQRERRLNEMNEAALAERRESEDDRIVREALAQIEDPLTMDIPSDPAPRTTTPADQSDRESQIAKFNRRPGQAPHGSVFSVVSPGSQETDDDQSLTEADEAAIARADKKFAEQYGPGDPPVLVDGQFTEADSSKPGPGNTGAFVDGVPTALDLTPEETLAQTQASLPGGSGPRVGDRDEDVQREDASRVAARKTQSQDRVSKILVGLREQVMGGNVDIREANRYLNDLYESPNVDKDQLGLFQNSLNEEFQAQQILNEEFQAKQIPTSGVNQ